MEPFNALLSNNFLTELLLLSCAFMLCAIVGIERQLSQKSAGLRTHVLVGLGAAGFTLVSAYGFASSDGGTSIVDPTRIAAQIVSGVGFLGAGLIFMRRDMVRGLTTAASIWLTAAIGMACGAAMVPLAALLVAFHLATTRLVAPLLRRLPERVDKRVLRIRYEQGAGALRSVLNLATEMGAQIALEDTTSKRKKSTGKMLVTITLRVIGRVPMVSCVDEFSRVPGVDWVRLGAHDTED